MEVLTGADISHEVEKVIVHGYYDDEPRYNNDIALIKVYIIHLYKLIRLQDKFYVLFVYKTLSKYIYNSRFCS